MRMPQPINSGFGHLWILLLILLALPILALAGCGSSDSPDQQAAAKPFTSSSSDYDPAKGPKELAGRPETDLVVRGVTDDPHTGRIWGESKKDFGAITSVVVPISVDAVEQGSLPVDSHDMVYLEIFTSVGRSTKAIMEGLGGRDGIFYLSKLPNVFPKLYGTTVVVDPNSGRPAGQPMFQPSSPEGVLVEADDGNGVLSVDAGIASNGASLDDFSPSTVKFPAHSNPG